MQSNVTPAQSKTPATTAQTQTPGVATTDRRALGAMGFDAATRALEPDGPIDCANLEKASGGGRYTDISKMPHKLYSNDGIQVNDVLTQGLEDCFLLASIAAIARTNPQRVRSMITPGPGGGYYVDVGGKKVLVTELLARASSAQGDLKRAQENLQKARTPDQQKLAKAAIAKMQSKIQRTGAWDGAAVEFSDVEQGRPELWVAVIQQAYLQTNGGQTGGDPKNALNALAGGGRSSQVFWAKNEKSLPKLLQILATKEPCVISTRGGKGLTQYGIALGHAVAAVGTSASGAIYHETTGEYAGNDVNLPWRAFHDGTVERVTINAKGDVIQKALAQARK